MRKTIYLMALVLLAGLSAGVVGHDCPEGQVCITSGGDGPESTAVEKNGSDWNSSLKVEGISPSSNISERITNATYDQENSSYKVQFDGVMRVDSPCYKPTYSVNSDGDRYSISISAEKEANSSCTQVITKIDYSMEFESESAFNLSVSQGNISETFTHPDYSQEDSNQDGSNKEETTKEPVDQDKGLLAGLISWLGNLF